MNIFERHQRDMLTVQSALKPYLPLFDDGAFDVSNQVAIHGFSVLEGDNIVECSLDTSANESIVTILTANPSNNIILAIANLQARLRE